MRIQRNKRIKFAFRVCTLTLLSALFLSMLSGCSLLSRLGIGAMDSINGDGNANADANALGNWDALDTALIAAAAQVADDGSMLAEYQDGGQGGALYLSADDATLVFDLSQVSVSKRSGIGGGKRLFAYTAGMMNAEISLSRIADLYRQHLSATYSNVSVGLLETDADRDGEDECVLFVEGMLESLENEAGIGAGDTVLDKVFRFYSSGICLYLDINGDKLVYQAAAARNCNGAERGQARIENGVLKLTDKEGVSESFLIVDAASIGNTAYSEQSFINVSNGYANGLVAQGVADVRARRADVVPVHGDEILLCYGEESAYTFELVAWYQGRPVIVYSFGSTDNGALFLTPEHDRFGFFAYQQDFESIENQNYSYQIFLIDENYCIRETKSDVLSVNLNNSVDDTTNNFFKSVMECLESVVVCYDPYKLTGYTVMPSDKDSSSALPEKRYLSITNCSTSKSGYVSVEDSKTWLSLREGPSTSYNRVLMDPSKKRSYVKQSLYTPVTILSAVNTGDAKNPIWVQLQVVYKNRTFVGYSSQNYIVIPGIRTLGVGEVFTVTADTNDSGLRFSSSDPAVAYVDPFSGRITAYKAGLVLITVTTDSGLEESCLVKIV